VAPRICGFVLTLALACECVPGQETSRIDPQQRLWQAIKKQLVSPDGDEYFNSSMKNALLPTLKGTVVSIFTSDSDPASRSLVIAVADSTRADATLVVPRRPDKLGAELRNGMQVEFSGVPQSFTKDPFGVVFEVERAQEPIPALGAMASTWYFGPDRGSVRNGRYRNTDVEFDLPAGWSVRERRTSSDDSSLAVLENSQLKVAAAAVWMARQRIRSAEISGQLEKLLADSGAKRSDLANYSIRPGTVRPTWIGGKQALQAVADYEGDGQPMSETLTLIVTERAKVVFFARSTTDRMPELQSWFDRLVFTALVP
jgi:hypothetical protein